MIIPLAFGIDLLLFARLAVGEGLYLPARALAIGKKNEWVFGVIFWFEKGDTYGGTS